MQSAVSPIRLKRDIMKNKKNKNTVINGIIVPSRWDENGQVIGISVHTFDEEEFIVEPVRLGKVLSSFLQQKIEIIGKIKERIDGRKLINVRSYTIDHGEKKANYL